MPRWPPPEYRIRTDFRAPLAYVFRWCTDYRPDDSHLIGEEYERRILERTPRRVVFEDLWWEPEGWRWRRSEVALRPPAYWHADSVGNVRDASIDYQLKELPDGGTRLELRMRRRPGPRSKRQPAKRELENDLRKMWRGFAKALETDYRRSRPKRGSTMTRSRARASSH
ncbi:MAG: hypothetical protein ABSB97_05185 [Thermoplasmata archaeon]|jgi:hypothetical protein